MNIAPFGLALLPSYYSKAMQDTLSGLEDFARNYMDDVLMASYTETSTWTISGKFSNDFVNLK